MKVQRKFIGIAVALLVSACSTTPVTQQSAARVPTDRIYQTSYIGAASVASDATVVFLRDSGFSGSGCSHDLYVDNMKVFAIRQGEQITIHVPAGQRVFRLETGGGLCPNISMSQETIIAAGARQVYRILLPSDGSLRLTRIE
ncbi:MAG TPA: hypothetical protein ENI26_12080 [Methylophaga aminisulfidivorans]|uniref:DUF2846 domain-containing protein n=2 Tax=root TaxID=1 RepID=A0A7C1ZIL4_9GAMM|nr:hypothetical protein [Methylophaga aminisulfidivorans]